MHAIIRQLVEALFGLMVLVIGVFFLVLLLKGNATGTSLRYIGAGSLILLGGRRIQLSWNALHMLLVLDERMQDELCHKCDYNLTGNVSGVCPQCGVKVCECGYNLTGNESVVCPDCGTPVALCPERAKDSSPG